MFDDAVGIAALARGLQAALVDVGRENLYPGSFLERFLMLQQKHPDRIGFLAGSAADDADAHLRVLFFAVEKFWNDLAAERLESFGVAKKLCHADQQIAKEPVRFLRPLL